MGWVIRVGTALAVGAGVCVVAKEHPQVFAMTQDISARDPAPASMSLTFRKKEDRAEWIEQGGPIAIIRSASGIGGAKLKLRDSDRSATDSGWPETIRVRLVLRGLENLVLKRDAEKILTASLSSSAGSEAQSKPSATKLPIEIEWVKNRKPPEELDCKFEILPVYAPSKSENGADGPEIPEERIGFEIRISRELVRSASTIELEWIDFYR